jgi:hypothetical protein
MSIVPISQVVFATSVTRVSIVTLLEASSVAKSDARIFDAVAAVATQTPSINEPFVLAFAVTVTEVGKNVGVTVSDAPTKASAENESV